jgi:acyl-CoA synthetase (AMP-forming)/AMP-acid ligase II
LPRAVDYDAFLATGNDFFEWPVLDENAPMGLCYTSGTTGKPKGVCYSHRSTYLHTLASCLPDALGLTGVDVVLPVVPMFHAMAWGVSYSTIC